MSTGFTIGPVTIHYYGILIILGILIGLYLVAKEGNRRGESLDFLIDAMPWVLLGAVVGARIWHILTPPQSMVDHGITTRYYLTHLNEALAVWKGGIGIFGAVLGGTIALSVYARFKGIMPAVWLDIIAPGLALSQAIGRWGNFINQEVYGLPSSLPWAITIDPQHRLSGFSEFATYHPIFLYESIWNILNMVFLLWVGRKYQDSLRQGSLFLIYLIFYGIGRVSLEFLRLDISYLYGVNINQIFIAAVVIVASFLFCYRQKGFSEVLYQE